MVSTYADKNGDNPCRPDGLVPDVEMEDNPIEPYQLGDDREALLREALTRAGYSDLTPMSKAVSRSTQSLGKQVAMKRPEGRRILLVDKREIRF